MTAPAAIACRHFGACGGCTALDVPIAEQLARKHARTTELLRPFLGRTPLDVDPPPGTPRHYRMKLLYPVRPGAGGELQAGLYAAGSHALVPITECQIQARALTLIAQRITELLRAHGVRAYDEATGHGTARALFARIAPGTGEMIVGLVTTDPHPGGAPALVEQIVAASAGLPRASRAPVHLVGVVHNVHPTPGNVLLGRDSTALWGRDHIVDRTDSLTFRIGFASFYQVHRHASALLYRPALHMIGDVRGQRVVDGYGGVGTFALRLAAAGARHVDLVEASRSACADARAAAAENGLADRVHVVEAVFAEADVEPGPDLAVVDPPRAGLGADGAARVLALDAPRVLYVSCAAESLARDMTILGTRYQVTAARLCDLFPHTPHAEVLLSLQRTGGR